MNPSQAWLDQPKNPTSVKCYNCHKEKIITMESGEREGLTGLTNVSPRSDLWCHLVEMKHLLPSLLCHEPSQPGSPAEPTLAPKRIKIWESHFFLLNIALKNSHKWPPLCTILSIIYPSHRGPRWGGFTSWGLRWKGLLGVKVCTRVYRILVYNCKTGKPRLSNIETGQDFYAW